MKYTAQPELERLYKLYLKNWKLFAISMVGCIALAVAFLLVKNPTFAVTASVLVKDDSSSGADASSMASSMMRGFAYGDLLGMGGAAVDDEIIILGSHSTIYSAVREQQLNIQYTARPFLRKKHFFDDTPVRLIPETPEMADTLGSAILFKVKVNREGKVYVKATTTIKRRKITLARVEGTFPLVVETEMGSFTLDGTPYLKPNKTTRMKILYDGYAATTDFYQKKFDIDFASKKSNVIVLMFSDVNKTRGKAFLTAMINQYNKYSLEEKNADAQHMSTFLANRIQVIQTELAQQDIEIEQFKESNKLTDLSVEMKVLLERNSTVREKRMLTEKQIGIIQTTEAFIKDPNNQYSTVPLTISVVNGEVSTVLNNYNTLLTERQISLRSTTEDNPAITRMNDRINAARNTVLMTLANLEKVTLKTLEEVYDEENKMMNKLENVPLIEREFYTLQRESQVTNTLYLYLLQQQAQNEIKLTSDAPKTQIVDNAYTSVRPVSPKPLLILAAAFILALILPVIYLRLHRAVKPHVDNAFELSQLLSSAPIYQLTDNCPEDLHQPVDEAYMNDLRNLRSEIDWSKTEPNSGKVLVVSSMERSVGKSKIAYHLAESIAQTQRRVLWIDADLRYSVLGATPLGHTDKKRTLVPMLERHETTPEASQLFSPVAALPYLQLLPATDGLQNSVPAADLLQSPQWNALLAWARSQYDAIIIDTTALNQYPDTLPLLRQADSCYFVFTAEKSTVQSTRLLQTLVDAAQVNDLHLVLNVNKKLS